LRVLLESHAGALSNMRALCEGMHALRRTHELGAKVQGEASRDDYLKAMEKLCGQQKLLAMLLYDAVCAEREPGTSQGA
jgi:hypothetical protein